ncbi:MAG: DUF5403 family protein [Tagaea sp.]|nr:DUF5403 family protein [Tagaea sp.]
MSAKPVLATLPAGTNHDFVARRYAGHRGLAPEPLACASPRAALQAVLERRADRALVCAAHPDAPALPAEFHQRLYVVDAFVSASKPLALVSRAQIAKPFSVGIFVATLGLADLSRWKEIVVEREGTIADVETRLTKGAYDSALVYRDFFERVPGYRLEAEIDSPDDAWIVFGRERGIP